jgi:photosystem II stability/assembly factor-like uncharacterized protein
MNQLYRFSACLFLFSALLFAEGFIAQVSNLTTHLRDIYVLNNTTAVVVGDGGVILTTTDVGGNWIQQTSGTGSSLTSVSFADATTGWAAGPEVVVKTVDGGTNWAVQTVPKEAGDFYFDIEFASATHGWIALGLTITATTDGGLSWTVQDPGTPYLIFKIFGLNTSQAWATGAGTVIISTTSGGADWTAQRAGIDEVPSSSGIYFINEFNGWVVAGTTVFRTTDGGYSWDSLSTGTVNQLYSICFLDALQGYVTGAGGTILYTNDGGNTWYPQPTGTENAIYSINMLYVNFGWAVGSNGTVLLGTGPVTEVGIKPYQGKKPVCGPFYLHIAGQNQKFKLKGKSGTRVDILDLKGNLVNILHITTNDIVWNGKDYAGNAAACGVYVARLTDGVNSVHSKILLNR